jgi:two-component system CheB/CheR fusion protein
MGARKRGGNNSSKHAYTGLLADDRLPPMTDNVRQMVAVGASAGGLDALERLFSGLPTNTGATFVIIQHLSPDHKSMMDSLLARHTAMPVIVVEDEMLIEADKVYLIPPGSLMHVDGMHLRLTPKVPRTLTLPIDVFFESMAKEYQGRSVGVVLSGTGSDGTRGAAAINEAGGFLIAQDPEDAKFDGMPRSVIATGFVDAVLPIEAIAERLVSHLRAPKGEIITLPAETPMPTLLDADKALSGVAQLLLSATGINFADYKRGTIVRRIARRMSVRQVPTIAAYLDLLSQDRSELLLLGRELLISVTRFFRDPEAFDALRQDVVEPLVRSRASGQEIRVWCAGIATGEEVYSIAMQFLEVFDEAKVWPGLKIFATDVDQAAIDTASAGIYPGSIIAEVSQQQLERFFVARGDKWQVKPELRQCIVFARHNLLTDPPFTRMDLVTCRNTLIYFRSEAQERVLRRLQYGMAKGGFLFLGSSESLGSLQPDFRVVSAREKIWQVARPATGVILQGSGRSPSAAHISASRVNRQVARPSLPRNAVDMGYQALLKAYAPPPAILVTAGHQLVHFFGDVRQYLELREGEASLEIGRILPEPLVPVAAALLFRVLRENSSASSDIVRMPTPRNAEAAQASRFVRLSGMPVGEIDGERHILLIFEDAQNQSQTDGRATVDVEAETTERLAALEHELAATRETLQATIEELETSNEELQATNEELMASNEELQSTNEELQSVNEELNTVNSEYQEKIEILNRVNADLESLAKVVASGTVFVDQNLNLTRFSEEAKKIFRLRESDIGRPLSDLNHELDYPDLMNDLTNTLEISKGIERSICGQGGRFYLVKMLPYRIPSSSSRGVVVSFVETTSIHKANLLQNVIDGLAEHVAVLDKQGDILLINDAWRQFAYENGDLDLEHSGPGANYLAVCKVAPDSDDTEFAHRASVGLRKVLRGEVDRFSMEYPCHSPTEQRWFVMNVRRLQGEVAGAVISHSNITDLISDRRHRDARGASHGTEAAR